MRPDRVVVPPPALHDDLGVAESVEDFAVEQLVAQASVMPVYTYSNFDIPLVRDTKPSGINDSGQIVGAWMTCAPTPCVLALGSERGDLPCAVSFACDTP